MAGRAALRRDRGAAPEGVDGANLWHGRLSERGKKHQRGRKGEKGGPSPATSFPGNGGSGQRRYVRAVLRACMWVCCGCKEERGSSSSA
jgi:hypothetical protein